MAHKDEYKLIKESATCIPISPMTVENQVKSRISNLVIRYGADFDHEELLSIEIHDLLRAKESQMPRYKGCSPQLCYRRFLVDWMAVISQKLTLSHGVLHLSVLYLDFVMDKFDFSKESQLNLLALCCLWVAGL